MAKIDITKRKNKKGEKMINLVAGHGYGNKNTESQIKKGKMDFDPGAVAIYNNKSYFEYDKNKEFVDRLGIKLAYEKMSYITWIRENGKPFPLTYVASICEGIYVEFHMNSSGKIPEKAEGIECFFYNKEDKTSQILSASIYESIMDYAGDLGIKGRGIKTNNNLANLRVCYNRRIPHCLIELGFLKNKKDFDFMNNETNINNIIGNIRTVLKSIKI